MAFSVGMISYTILKLISGFKENDFVVNSDNFDQSLSQQTTDLVFDEKKVAEFFENQQITKNDISTDSDLLEFLEGTNNEKKEEIKAEIEKLIEKPKENVKQTPQEIYEEIQMTERFLKYNYDYGDLYNLRIRNNFASKYGDSINQTLEKEKIAQKEKFKEKDTQKLERLRNERKRIADLEIQKEFAEKYTKFIVGKD